MQSQLQAHGIGPILPRAPMTLHTSNRLDHPLILTFENNGEASVLLLENAVRLVMSVTEGMEATVGGAVFLCPTSFGY